MQMTMYLHGIVFHLGAEGLASITHINEYLNEKYKKHSEKQAQELRTSPSRWILTTKLEIILPVTQEIVKYVTQIKLLQQESFRQVCLETLLREYSPITWDLGSSSLRRSYEF